MPTLKFIDANRINPDRDGMDVIFNFIDENEENHKYHVVGGINAWNFTKSEQRDYAEILFTGLLIYLDNFWQDYKSLPEEGQEIHDRLDFPKYGTLKTNWENYVLVLK